MARRNSVSCRAGDSFLMLTFSAWALPSPGTGARARLPSGRRRRCFQGNTGHVRKGTPAERVRRRTLRPGWPPSAETGLERTTMSDLRRPLQQSAAPRCGAAIRGTDHIVRLPQGTWLHMRVLVGQRAGLEEGRPPAARPPPTARAVRRPDPSPVAGAPAAGLSESQMETLALLGTALGLSLASGLSLYGSAFLVGLAIHLGWVQLAPGWERLAVLADPLVLGIAAVLFAMEFFADKIPWVDSAWDVVHTFIRPVGGALLASRGVRGPASRGRGGGGPAPGRRQPGGPRRQGDDPARGQREPGAGLQHPPEPDGERARGGRGLAGAEPTRCSRWSSAWGRSPSR